MNRQGIWFLATFLIVIQFAVFLLMAESLSTFVLYQWCVLLEVLIVGFILLQGSKLMQDFFYLDENDLK